MKKRILILWRPNDDGIGAIVEIFTVPVHESPKDWFVWLDSAREAAEAAGLALYNWGNVEPVSREKAMERINSYNKDTP